MPDGRTLKFNQPFHRCPEQGYGKWTDFHSWRKYHTLPEYSNLDWTGEEELRKRMERQQTAI